MSVIVSLQLLVLSLLSHCAQVNINGAQTIANLHIAQKLCAHAGTKSYVRKAHRIMLTFALNDSVWLVDGAANGSLIYWIVTRLDFVPDLRDISSY